MSQNRPKKIPQIHRRLAEHFDFAKGWEDHLVIWVMPKNVAAICVFIVFAGGFFLSAMFELVFTVKSFSGFVKANPLESFAAFSLFNILLIAGGATYRWLTRLNSDEDDTDLV